jgi:cell pole-organizing protein PopZ
MSSQANTTPQTEPTMEEILASIRKIISEDQPAEGAKPVARPAPPKPQPVAASAPETVAARVAAPAAPAGDLDVLDLTDEVQDEDAPAPTIVRAAPPPAPAPSEEIADEVIFQNIEPVSKVKERPMDDDLISDNTRHAMGRTFANLNGGGGHAPQVTLKGGSIESIFTDAVQNAFRASLREWIDDHSNDVMDQLRPLIRAWMDEHLPPLVEAAVIKEIGRAAARKP